MLFLTYLHELGFSLHRNSIEPLDIATGMTVYLAVFVLTLIFHDRQVLIYLSELINFLLESTSSGLNIFSSPNFSGQTLSIVVVFDGDNFYHFIASSEPLGQY